MHKSVEKLEATVDNCRRMKSEQKQRAMKYALAALPVETDGYRVSLRNNVYDLAYIPYCWHFLSYRVYENTNEQ